MSFVLPVKRRTEIEQNLGLGEFYDLLYLPKRDPFLFQSDATAFEFPPYLVRDQTGMEDNNLTLVVAKPRVFGELLSQITLSGAQTVPDGVCSYPLSQGSAWETWVDESHAYHRISLPWVEIRTNCQFEVDTSNARYDEYAARLNFVENYYEGRRRSMSMANVEEYFFDIEVQERAWEDFFSAYIVDHTFDRETRVGTVEFSTATRYPNYFVFPDIAIVPLPYKRIGGDFYAATTRLGEVSGPPPQYILTEKDVLFVEEIGGSSTLGFQPSRRSESCDESTCYQSWKLTFQLISDPRVCSVPITTIPINWVSHCTDMSPEYYQSVVINALSSQDDPSCVFPSVELSWNINLSINNLCGGMLVENIDTTFDLGAYFDWTYQNSINLDDHVFEIDDWIYLKASLDSPKVTITSVALDSLFLLDNVGTSFELLRNGEVTNLGMLSKLVVDDASATNEVTFHFQLTNELVALQPNEKQSFSIEAFLAVSYEGNSGEVIPSRRDEVNVGQTFVEKTLLLNIEYVDVKKFSFLAYGIFVVFSSVGAVLFGVLLVVFVASFVREWRRKVVEGAGGSSGRRLK